MTKLPSATRALDTCAIPRPINRFPPAAADQALHRCTPSRTINRSVCHSARTNDARDRGL